MSITIEHFFLLEFILKFGSSTDNANQETKILNNLIRDLGTIMHLQIF